MEGVVVYAPMKNGACVPLGAEQWIKGGKKLLPGFMHGENQRLMPDLQETAAPCRHCSGSQRRA